YQSLMESNIELTVANIRFIKPLDKELLDYLYNLNIPIYTMEDNVLYGGLGGAILEYYSTKGECRHVKIFAHESGILEHGDKKNLLKLVRLDSETIRGQIYRDIRGKEWIETKLE
ncbi:MAG: hypothetical protein GX154_11010, partial [Clostridiales bacterium]|nr:hypothetical protein [Clostridiales bacterium]